MRKKKEMERNKDGLKRELDENEIENLRQKWYDFKKEMRFVEIWGVRKMK